MSDNKKAGSEVSFFTKVTDFAKKTWAKFLAIDWNASVKPVVGWSVFGGTVALSVLLMLICWL